jgi:hypothetical protein
VEELSQTQLNHLNATFLFETQRRAIIDQHFDDLTDLRTEPHIEFRCDNPYLVTSLRRCLPFGHYLTTLQKNILTGGNYKARLITHSRSQFLYWYLARAETSLRAPVDHLAIYYESEHFWFNHIASNRAAIIHRLLDEQRPVFFLQRFSLTHTFLQLEIGELRLVTNSASPNQTAYNLVHIPSTTWHINWTTDGTILFNPTWQVTPNHHDPRLVNPPQPYFLPPSSPVNSDTDSDTSDEIQYHLPIDINDAENDTDEEEYLLARRLPRPLPSPSWEEPAPDPGWTAINPYRRRPARICTCNGELCSCGYRPDTPTTPPHITLWTPGDQFLPFRS